MELNSSFVLELIRNAFAFIVMILSAFSKQCLRYHFTAALSPLLDLETLQPGQEPGCGPRVCEPLGVLSSSQSLRVRARPVSSVSECPFLAQQEYGHFGRDLHTRVFVPTLRVGSPGWALLGPQGSAWATGLLVHSAVPLAPESFAVKCCKALCSYQIQLF